MKVKDLMEFLSSCNMEDIVVLSSDSEGNNYSPLSGAAESLYSPDSTWSGSLVEPEDIEEYDMDESTLQNVVVLWPIS